VCFSLCVLCCVCWLFVFGVCFGFCGESLCVCVGLSLFVCFDVLLFGILLLILCFVVVLGFVVDVRVFCGCSCFCVVVFVCCCCVFVGFVGFLKYFVDFVFCGCFGFCCGCFCVVCSCWVI